MNWAIFSTVGYISVALWMCVPLLWLVHELRRPRGWLAHVALVLGVVAMVLAMINSRSHVARIAVDRSVQVQEQLTKQQTALELAEKQRAGESAQIRFAEDASGDRLDKAGLSEADRAYFDRLDAGATPDWKKEKKQRATGGAEEGAAEVDKDLESLIGAGSKEREGVKTEEFVEDKQRDPILMSEADKAKADRLDTANLTIIRLLLLLGVGYLMVDYVRRLNVDTERYLPLPLPSSWADVMTPRGAVATWVEQPGQSVLDELRTIARRGEVFIYLTDNPAAADEATKPMGRLPGGRWPIRAMNVADFAHLDDAFIFETLWYARGAFVVGSAERAESLLDCFIGMLAQRRETRARARQRVHIVWDIGSPVPESIRLRFESLADITGFRLLLCRPT